MWLDRIGHSAPVTPQSTSRSQTPLPLRRQISQRPPYALLQQSARNSSTSLTSVVPEGSLLASARRTNGTTTKQPQTLSGDPKDALAVLQKILQEGDGAPAGTNDDKSLEITETDLSADVDFDGLSLRQLVDGEHPATGLDNEHVYKPQSIEEYQHDKAAYEELQKSIRACDIVLASVETNLVSFRDDLAAVSADIETLQARSAALTVRLENRKAVEKGLGPIVEELSLSPMVVAKISEGAIDEAWIKALSELDKRAISFKKNAGSQQSKALSDLGPLLENLELKAIERIRDHLVAQIKSLRSPQINAQIIQQQHFLRYKELYAFLHRHHTVLADEICLAYLNTMRWYYANRFNQYRKALEKLKLHVIDKTNVLGHEDTSRKTTTVLGAARGAASSHDAFSLGRRMDLLKTTNQIAISSHLAEEDKAAHYLEVPFRNLNLAIIDNATAEYTFLANFFSPSVNLATIAKHSAYIFEPTFALGRASTKALAGDTYDALGLLLCIRLMQHFAFELQRRRVPAADSYVNATTMELWPRLQVVMSAHCESVRAMTAALPAAAGKAGTTASAAPHVVTQRFGQLLQGILAMGVEAGDDEPIVASLGRLRGDVEAFLTKYSQAHFGKEKRKAERFLYNNYSLIATIISDVQGGKLAEEQQTHFEEVKERYADAI